MMIRSLLFAAMTLCVAVLALPLNVASQDTGRKTQEPPAEKSKVQQPISFSHKQHVGFDMKCVECHPNPDPGDRMTLPTGEKCMECHRTIAKDRPSIQKLMAFFKSKEPVPWARIYVVSAWVFWNHRSHLDAGMKCESCHGDVAKMDTVIVTTDVTSMAGCVDCHKKNDVSTGCQFCHSGK